MFEFLARDFLKTSYTGYIARSILSSLPYYNYTLDTVHTDSTGSLPARCSRGSHYHVPCTSTCDSDQRNLILKMKAWLFDSSLEAGLIAWSTFSGILIAWFLVVNAGKRMHIQAYTIGHAHLLFMCSVRDQNVRKVAVADVQGILWWLPLGIIMQVAFPLSFSLSLSRKRTHTHPPRSLTSCYQEPTNTRTHAKKSQTPIRAHQHDRLHSSQCSSTLLFAYR